MNSKGQVLIFQIMLAVAIFIVAMAVAPALIEMSTNARNPDSGDTLGLDCDNSSISDFDKATCVITDVMPPYFIAILLGIAGTIVGARLLIQ